MDNIRGMQEDFFELIKQALLIKISHRGLKFGMCSIMNIKSGKCSEDCAFCAQSARHATNAPVFGLKSKEEILRHAQRAKELGATHFSLVASGRGPTQSELAEVIEAIKYLKDRIDIKICASLGIIDEDGLRALKEAGLSRYHHNIETSRQYFPMICSTHSFEERIKTIKSIKNVGLECCSGCILGIGETKRDRISIAETLKEIGVDSVPINILVPIEGTRLWGKTQSITPLEVVETIALFRHILKTPAIRLAGGRENGLGDFQSLAFMAGADALMIGGYLTTPGRDPELDLRLKTDAIEFWKRFRDNAEN